MKTRKITAVLLLLAMLFTVTACGKKQEEDTSTPAKAVLAEFKSISGIDGKSCEEIANQLVNNPALGFSPVVMPVEEGFLNGFSADITGFEEGCVFAPMIGSIPFIGYVFTVGSDAEGFMQKLKDNADLRWNICTQADEMVCGANGSKVLLVMSPASFEE